MEDHQIVDMLYHRDEKALEELANKYKPYCGTIAWHILRNHEDSEE